MVASLMNGGCCKLDGRRPQYLLTDLPPGTVGGALAQLPDLASVFRGTKLKGDIDHTPSMAGSLVIALGGAATMEAAELAAMGEHVVNSIVNSWTDSVSLAADDDQSPR